MSTDTILRSGATPSILYFVRHGETEYNRRDIIQGGEIDCEMNDTGRAQARALARRLASIDLDGVYASTLRRAKETASILAHPHTPVSRTYLRDLNEMNWGVFEGEPHSSEREASMGTLKENWRAGALDLPVEEGESPRDVQSRARRALRHILIREVGRTALVVSHGRYLRILLATLLDGYDLTNMPKFGHSNTCVNRVVVENGHSRADLLNCTAHLTSSEEAVV